MADPVPRTLILTRHYAPEPTGSAPPMQLMAEWLAAHGRDVELITSRPSYPETRVFALYAHGEHDDARENGVHVRRWPTWPVRGAGLLARALPETRFMLQLITARLSGAGLSGAGRPSAEVISLCPSILTVAAAALFRAAGGTHVVILHDIQSGLGAALGSRRVRLIMGMLRRVERWALGRADNLVVLSQSMADAVVQLGVRTPITILPPQIDCGAIVPLPQPDGPPTLMYSGNLGRKQGLAQILDLAAILRHDAPDIRIIIRGEGALRVELAARIASEGLGNVALLPLVDRADIAASLASAHLHLVPQIAAGGDFAVPSKAYAIMAAARPFVTTATAGSAIARMAEESGGFVITPPDDASAFARIIIALLADPVRCADLGRRGRAYVETTADTDVVMRQLAALLRRA